MKRFMRDRRVGLFARAAVIGERRRPKVRDFHGAAGARCKNDGRRGGTAGATNKTVLVGGARTGAGVAAGRAARFAPKIDARHAEAVRTRRRGAFHKHSCRTARGGAGVVEDRRPSTRRNRRRLAPGIGLGRRIGSSAAEGGRTPACQKRNPRDADPAVHAESIAHASRLVLSQRRHIYSMGAGAFSADEADTHLSTLEPRDLR
jgi:hypothetical protein